jgi:hypothetical protein
MEYVDIRVSIKHKEYIVCSSATANDRLAASCVLMNGGQYLRLPTALAGAINQAPPYVRLGAEAWP